MASELGPDGPALLVEKRERLAAEADTVRRLQAQAWQANNQPGLLRLTEKLLNLQQQQDALRVVAEVEGGLQQRLSDLERGVQAVHASLAALRQDVAGDMAALRSDIDRRLEAMQALLQAPPTTPTPAAAPAPTPAAAQPQPPAVANGVAAHRDAGSAGFDCPPFLSEPDFLAEERDCPLLAQDGGHLGRETAAVLASMAEWPALLPGLAVVPVPEDVPELDVNIERIIEKDVERTFLLPSHRESLKVVLRSLAHEFKAYAQAMSYVCGLFMLALPPATAAAMLRVLNGDPRYIPGYWTTEAVQFATDAYVFQSLLEERDPALAKHMQAATLLPEMYLQKWFCVLCIQNLPFQLGLPFLERFLRGGHGWLFQFALAVHAHFREQLLATKSADVLLGILRLDPKVTAANPITPELFHSALGYDLSAVDIPARRVQAYETHLKARMERARAMAAETSEVTDSEEEADED
eukprot:EG_transcript_9770